MLESMFRSAFPHARSPKAARAHARSRKAFDYMAISGLLSNRIRDHPAMASQIRMPYVPGFHQTLPLLSLRPVLHRLRDMPGAQPFRALQVGDRARHPQRPVQHAGRAAQAAHGLPQQLPPARPARNDGPAPRRPRPRWACPDVPIAAHGRPGPARAPPARPPRRPVQVFRGHRRQAQMQVDAVQQGRRRGPRSAPPGRACRRRPAPDVRATRRGKDSWPRPAGSGPETAPCAWPARSAPGRFPAARAAIPACVG